LVQRLEPKLDDVAKAVGKLTREITGNGGVGLAERVRANARRLDERDRLRVEEKAAEDRKANRRRIALYTIIGIVGIERVLEWGSVALDKLSGGG